MPVNNQIYSAEASGWWDENHFLYLLKSGLNPARFGYFRGVLIDQLFLDPKQLSVLDAGCGGGILSEEFARLGCRVTGIDPSADSLRAANVHATHEGLRIAYCQGRAEDLPFPSAAWMLSYAVMCWSMWRITRQYWRRRHALSSPAACCSMTPSIARDVRALENIFAAQEFPLTRFFPRHTHVWEKFIRPEELLTALERAGLKNREMAGCVRVSQMLKVAALLVQRKLGLISFAGLGRRLKFTTGSSLEASYLGWAVKG